MHWWRTPSGITFEFSLTLEVLRRKGHVPDGDIKIDGGDQRDITIHPPKIKEK